MQMRSLAARTLRPTPDEAGQHEAESGEESSELAAPDAAEVDAQLVRLGARQQYSP
jgi:hypothetical protein